MSLYHTREIIAYREFTRNYNEALELDNRIGIIAYREFTRNYNHIPFGVIE